jgi:hypothetical protein
VQHNAYGPSGLSKSMSSLKMTEDSAPHKSRGILDKLQDTGHNVGTAVAESGEHLHQELKEAGENIQGVVSPTEDDVDEGWASEGSAGSAQGSPTGSKKTRSRSSKQKSLGNAHPSGSSTRKRHSRHRAIPRGGGDGDDNQHDSRDLTPLRRGFHDSDSRRGSLRNIRLDFVRNTRPGSSRDQSPARSVRFIDEDNRVYSSRVFTSPNERPSSSPHNPEPSDDESSPKARVTFDVSSQT